RVMPRTANGFPDEDALGEGSVVMRAFAADRKQFLPAARQQYRLARNLPEQHAPIGDLAWGYPLGKIAAVQLLFVAHEASSRSAPRCDSLLVAAIAIERGGQRKQRDRSPWSSGVGSAEMRISRAFALQALAG